jgi:hypothetical protein
VDTKTLDLNFLILAQPKAGSTWLVHLLSSFICKDYKFDDLEKIIPMGGRTLPYRVHSSTSKESEDTKKILLIRNPFDSVVSWKNYSVLRNQKYIQRDLSPYYREIKHNTLTIRYEDLNLDTHVTMTKILKFLKWKYLDQEITDIINKCKLKNLKNYEDKSLIRDNKFLFYDSKQQLNNNIRFYNKGQCYSFKDKLTLREIKRLYIQYETAINKHWPELKDCI